MSNTPKAHAPKLPYYKMYPADFDADEKVRLMSLAELGLFVTCLNCGWLNDGLPVDIKEVARAVKADSAEFRRAWPKVELCWPVVDGRRRNSRQEEERTKARAKSEQATDAIRKRYGRSNGRVTEKDVGVAPRAYDSDSDSLFEVEFKNSETSLLVSDDPPDFSEATSDPLEILAILRPVYRAAGVPIATKHEQQALQLILGIPPHKRHRILAYVKHAFESGKWRTPSKTKGILNLLNDGDWDVDIVERTLPQAREMDATDIAYRNFAAKRGEL